MPELSGLYYPNRFARYFFLAIEDVMGQGGLTMLLNLAGLDRYVDAPPADDLARGFDFAEMAALQIGLEEMYGVRGGRGMALRIGRASFSMGLRHFGALRGVATPAFRRQPLDQRCRLGLDALAAVFTTFSDQRSSASDAGPAYCFQVEVSPMAWGRTAEKPVCHALAGIVQECMRWVSNGFEYYVHETECRACGAARCTFTINKTPIGQR